MQADILIHAQWVLPVDPADRVLTDHALAIGEGRILALVPSTQARVEFQARQTLELPGHVLIPGLINAHTHSPMTLMRGLADDLPLMTWLNEHIWPAERRWVDPDFVAAGTRLAALEMLRSGTTCFNDMYFYPEVTGAVVAEAGMRALVGMIVLDFPTNFAEGADDYLRKGLELHERFRGHPLVRTAFAPHSPYAVSDGPLARVQTLADELEVQVHIHLHETHDEVFQSLRDHGQRPLARLDRLGLVGPGLVAVHMTQVEDAEMALLAEAGAHVVHCPQSNLKLASGFCPVARLLAAGVKVALGTDGAASNNDLDMLSELRVAALLGKGVAGSASAVPARAALRMATIDAACALGMDAEIGSLEPGKAADLVALDLRDPDTQPVYQPLSQLVYAASRDQVRHVWVAGRQLIRDRVALTLDREAILTQARDWGARIAAADRRG
ncbi:MAG TPA: TRZ/ATZ family hydrolase [Chromatiaceae bacterium]|nr:TRZ/ATZ family hydrolase [Chromatiaceae bacterium]